MFKSYLKKLLNIQYILLLCLFLYLYKNYTFTYLLIVFLIFNNFIVILYDIHTIFINLIIAQ
jgi:hypothetical protein